MGIIEMMQKPGYIMGEQLEEEIREYIKKTDMSEGGEIELRFAEYDKNGVLHDCKITVVKD